MASRGIFPSLVYLLLRFTPAVAALAVIEFSQLSPDDLSLVINRLCRLVAVLAGWNIAEGVCMLWVRERNAGSPRSRGYGLVTIIAAGLVLLMLQLFRVQSSRTDFLILLSALSLRGMSRGGWDQGRPQISVFTSLAAHTLTAALSFLLSLGALPWPTLVIAASFGTLVGGVEAAWNGGSFAGRTYAWLLPVRRLSFMVGPLAVTTLTLLGFLPPLFLAMCALVVANARVVRTFSIQRLTSGTEVSVSAGMYLAFLVIMGICRAYS